MVAWSTIRSKGEELFLFARGTAHHRPGAARGGVRAGLLLISLLALALSVLACANSRTWSPPDGSATTPPSATSPADGPEAPGTGSDVGSFTSSAAEEMSLPQLAAQVLVVGFPPGALDDPASALNRLVAIGPPGGIILFGDNLGSAAGIRGLTNRMQSLASVAGSHVPLLVAVDQEGGPVQRIRDGVPEVPSARKLAAEGTPERVHALAQETGERLLALGITTNFAPVADVVADTNSFLHERSYGEDPEEVAAFVTAAVTGYERAGLVSAVKHFPGHGSTQKDTHSEGAIATPPREAWAQTHLPPFEAAMEAGVPMVMVGHFSAPALGADGPASQSADLIEGVLREHLGFNGIVVTDDLAMAAAGATAEAAVASLDAGADLLILSSVGRAQLETHARIVAAVRTGELSEDRLREAVARILAAKEAYGVGSAIP